MPHCIVEHSPEFNARTLCSKVFEKALESGLFCVDGSDIKVRTMEYSTYQTGTEMLPFIHVCIKLLSGRDEQQRLMLSDLVVRGLNGIALPNTCITAEVVEMHKATYSKQSY